MVSSGDPDVVLPVRQAEGGGWATCTLRDTTTWQPAILPGSM